MTIGFDFVGGLPDSNLQPDRYEPDGYRTQSLILLHFRWKLVVFVAFWRDRIRYEAGAVDVERLEEHGFVHENER